MDNASNQLEKKTSYINYKKKLICIKVKLIREDPRQYINLEQRHQIRMNSVCGEGGGSGAAGGATCGTAGALWDG